jgi:hypothetical protein
MITSSFPLYLHLIILLSMTLATGKESSNKPNINYGNHWSCSNFFFSYPIYGVDCTDNNLVVCESQKYSKSCKVAGTKTPNRIQWKRAIHYTRIYPIASPLTHALNTDATSANAQRGYSSCKHCPFFFRVDYLKPTIHASIVWRGQQKIRELIHVFSRYISHT